MTSLNYSQSLSKHLTHSLEEIANSLIPIRNQLDSLEAMVLQNRRGLDLLTAEKGGLFLFLEEACSFYTNKSGTVKEAARNLTNRAWRIRQHLSNSWENLLSNWIWMPWVLPYLDPLLLLTLILTFSPCLMCLFSKFLQYHSNRTIHKQLLTHSDYQKFQPDTNPLDPQPFLILLQQCPCSAESSYRRLTFALILNHKGWNDRAYMGSH